MPRNLLRVARTTPESLQPDRFCSWYHLRKVSWTWTRTRSDFQFEIREDFIRPGYPQSRTILTRPADGCLRLVPRRPRRTAPRHVFLHPGRAPGKVRRTARTRPERAGRCPRKPG